MSNIVGGTAHIADQVAVASQQHLRQSSSVLHAAVNAASQASTLVITCHTMLQSMQHPKHFVPASGAVLVTPDGKWPAPDQEDALEDALKKCGIKRWELYKVDNSSSAAAPLTVPEGPMKTVESEVV